MDKQDSENMLNGNTRSYLRESEIPRIDSLLHFLDSEINLIQQRMKKTGITSWAILGGIATIIWLIFSEIENQTFSLSQIGLLFLVISVVIDGLVIIKKVIVPSNFNSTIGLRFVFSSKIAAFRPSLVMSILRASVLIVLVIHTLRMISSFTSWLLIINYGFFIIITLYLLIISFINKPLPFSGPMNKGSLQFLNIILSIDGVVLLIGYLILINNLFTGYDISHFRFASLLVTLSYLIMIGVRKVEGLPLYSSLIEIRRNVFLGRIDLQSAISLLDIAFDGLKIEDIFQQDVERILSDINKAKIIYKSMIDKYSQIEDNMSKIKSQSTRTEIHSILKKCSEDVNEIRDLVSSMKESSKNFKKNSNSLILMTEAARVEIKPLRLKILDQIDKMDELGKEFISKSDSLKIQMKSTIK